LEKGNFKQFKISNAILIKTITFRRYFKEEGELVLDVGSMAACLEFAASTKAKVVGKPEPDFFHAALQILQVEPSKVRTVFFLDC